MADRKTRFTQAIWQITQQLRDYKVLDNALSACLETIITTLDSEAGTIWLLDKSSNRLFPVFNHGPVDISGITIENGQGIAGSVVQSGESVITSSVGDDPRFTRSVDEESGFVTRTLICVPLKNAYETIGCIQIINRNDGGFYDQEDLILCEQMASLAAIAIEEKGLDFNPSAEKEVIPGYSRESIWIYIKTSSWSYSGNPGAGSLPWSTLSAGWIFSLTGSLSLMEKTFPTPATKN